MNYELIKTVSWEDFPSNLRDKLEKLFTDNYDKDLIIIESFRINTKYIDDFWINGITIEISYWLIEQGFNNLETIHIDGIY